MSHLLQDQRSLVMHRLIARRLRRDPQTRGALEWQPLLEGPLPRLLQVMTTASDEGQRLRQSSPFAGEVFIRQPERLRVLRKQRA